MPAEDDDALARKVAELAERMDPVPKQVVDAARVALTQQQPDLSEGETADGHERERDDGAEPSANGSR